MNGRIAGVLLIGLALLLDSTHAHAALEQAWPPFALVAGLLLIGMVAGGDGLFDVAAERLVRFPGSTVALALACFALVAIVTALLNLDTAAVFLTPVLVKTAQRRGVDTGCFLYGAIFMANASSLLLPGSNLTNLLVLSGEHISGATFFTRMLAAALAAPVITAIGLLVLHRRGLCAADNGSIDASTLEPAGAPPTHLRLRLGFWGALLAACLIAALHNAALPVLAVGLILLAVRTHGGELSWRESLLWLDVPTLAGLFGLAVALGTLARASAFPADLLHSPGMPATVAIAALSSVVVNNLPAAVLLASTAHLPMNALLLGLNVGPNLAVTGSLAAVLWWRSARAVGARPSALAYSRQGLVLAPLALLGALALNAV
ncbi:MAG TPA: SLC13 family permease [Solirubrobacteraceae bacterium]|jgi:arsenical pump membrane protein|nr:SLC13 family permease [Solirubrobacteraceae bacterium]